VPFELPESLKDTGYSTISRANIAQLVKFKSKAKVDEIYGLLHLVTDDAEHEHILSQLPSFDPSKPVEMSVYAAQQPLDWDQETLRLNEKHPVIVFSKSYCPFSKRAKLLLEQYDLNPPPNVIEVDLRDDNVQIKQILTRLTKQSTFPNIFVRGQSLGGSDDLHALHTDGSLKKILESAGVTIGAEKR